MPSLINRQFIHTVIGLLLLSGTLGAIPVPLIPPDVVQAVPAPLNSDTLIRPGQVGQISRTTSKQDLIQIFGSSNLQDFVAYGPEGEGQYPATRLIKNGRRSLEIIWATNQQQQVSSVRIYDSPWRTAEGIGVQTSVAQLQQLFGKFRFFGFAWDYSGYLAEGNPKFTQYRQRLNLSIQIGLPEGKCQTLSPDCQAVMGDQELSSTDAAVRRLNAQVVTLVVSFE